MQKSALLIGMTLEDFWQGHPQDFFVYQDLYIENQKRKQEEEDYKCWLQGFYFISSLAQVLQFKNPKKIYPKEPYLESEKKKNMSLNEKALAWVNRVNSKF